MLNETQRRQLAVLRDQIVDAMALVERVHRAHLAMITDPNVAFDPAVLQMLEGYIVGPIRLGASALAAGGLDDVVFANAAGNLSGFRGSAAAMNYILSLGCLQARIADLLRDPEPMIEAAVEIAFAHLQRSLVVDDGLRARWRVAFDDDEPACERLGGVHLLQHGLWGFKTDAAGERSDLVLGEHPESVGRTALNASKGLILSEWKRIPPQTTPASIATAVDRARRQLGAYARGSLAAVELRSVRYVVVVTEKRLPPIEDTNFGDYRVRHINLSVDPAPPSRSK